MHTLSVKPLIRFGWETFKERPWFFVVTFIVLGIFSSQLGYQSDNSANLSTSTTVIIGLVGIAWFFVQFLAKMGKTHLMLLAHEDTSSLRWKDLWAPKPFWRFLGASILVGIVVLIGLVLLIVPGIILALRYMFVPYIVMEKKLMPFQAMRESARMTHGHKWKLFQLALALIGINILGFLCLFVGLLVTAPVSSLAIVRAYRVLSRTSAVEL